MGGYAGIVTVTLDLDDAIAAALAAEATRRGQTTDQVAADLLAAQLPKGPPPSVALRRHGRFGFRPWHG
jgi:hypothetical protein